MNGRFFFRLMLVATLFALAGRASARAFKGRAYEAGTATQIMYTETYEEPTRPGAPATLRTEYRNPSGTLIAERTLDFSRHAFKPDYRLADLRDGSEEGARVLEAGGQGEAEVRVFFRAAREKPLREKILHVPEPCVIDGGFNAFIKAHWEELTAGRRVPFNFVAPSKRDYFAFEAVPADSSAPGARAEARATRTFLIRPATAALRLLVTPIRVTYDIATHRLTEYQGLSNLNDARGKSFQIRLVYPELGP